MTMNCERTRAVVQTQEFLEELARRRRDVPDDVIQEARRLLRHYPSAQIMNLTAKATEKFCPNFAFFASQKSAEPQGDGVSANPEPEVNTP